MTDKNKGVETAFVHEFWRCKREYKNFINYALLANSFPSDKEIRIIAFTSYGNFLGCLYSFYEEQIKGERNEYLLAGFKNKEAERISTLLKLEVKKLIKNKRVVYENNLKLDVREFTLNEDEIPTGFGTHLRNIRNGFAHAKPERVNNEDISLAGFYKLYHRYVLLLYESIAFTWDVKLVENYDWLEIENFLTQAQKPMKDTAEDCFR